MSITAFEILITLLRSTGTQQDERNSGVNCLKFSTLVVQ